MHPQVLFVLDPVGASFSRTWILFELWQVSLDTERRDRLVVLPAAEGWVWTPEMGLALTNSVREREREEVRRGL
jgi:hypothetical protein